MQCRMHRSSMHSGHGMRRGSLGSAGQLGCPAPHRPCSLVCQASSTTERRSDRIASTSGRSWEEVLRGASLGASTHQDSLQRLALERLYRLNGQLFHTWIGDLAHSGLWAPGYFLVTETVSDETREEASQQTPNLVRWGLRCVCKPCTSGTAQAHRVPASLTHETMPFTDSATEPATERPSRQEPRLLRKRGGRNQAAEGGHSTALPARPEL